MALAPSAGMMRGIPINFFDAAAAAQGNSLDYALLPRASLVTWQSSFAGAPASVTLQILTSNDGTNYSVTDSSTAVGGEIRTFQTSARFIRARINAISGGSGVTVQVVAKPIG